MERYTLGYLYEDNATFTSAIKGYISANSNLKCIFPYSYYIKKIIKNKINWGIPKNKNI